MPSLASAVPIVLQAPASSPIIVRIVEPPHDPTGVTDMLISAIGLTGALAVGAVCAGVIVGGIAFWWRTRERS